MALNKKEAKKVSAVMTIKMSDMEARLLLENMRSAVKNKSFRKHLKKVFKTLELPKKQKSAIKRAA